MTARRPALATLQRLINRSAKAHSDAFNAAMKLHDHCMATYGCSPSDVDADEIIDAVLGGCGMSAGMSAEAFDTIMRQHTSQRNKP